MWHVSSRSGVATLRTAIHLLLTYFLAAHYSYAWLKKIDRRMCPLVKMTMINRFLKVSERQLHYRALGLLYSLFNILVEL